MNDTYKRNRRREEIFNTFSHAAGMLLATAGMTVLIVLGAIYGTAWHVVSYTVFGLTMITLYAASTLFHAAARPRLKYYLNKFDHAAIYLLIAGSYTPISLISLRGPVGWTLFGSIWALAISGIVFKIWFYSARWRRLSAWLYVLMGWLVVVAIVPVIRNVPPLSLWLLLAGGLAYTAGVLFYLKKRVRYFHFIFHLFILAGSICHFFSFLFLIEF